MCVSSEPFCRHYMSNIILRSCRHAFIMLLSQQKNVSVFLQCSQPQACVLRSQYCGCEPNYLAIRVTFCPSNKPVNNAVLFSLIITTEYACSSTRRWPLCWKVTLWNWTAPWKWLTLWTSTTRINISETPCCMTCHNHTEVNTVAFINTTLSHRLRMRSTVNRLYFSNI